MSQTRSADGSQTELDAVIVGAGFAGLYMLHRLRELGLSARVFETASDVGGTWYWNRYPGARCDIESLEYSYQFSEELQQEWKWSERYATQPEILAYASHVADRFDLRPDIQFETRVESAVFNETSGRWEIQTSRGDCSATFCIMATGCLSSTNTPDFEGVESFEGDWVHTGNWPHEGVDFTGKRVGVIGTGSSAIQSIPMIAEEASHVHVFQRTANYSVPAHNAPLDPEFERQVKADYPAFRNQNAEMVFGFGARYPRDEVPALDVSAEDREAAYQARWEIGGLPFMGTFPDLGFSHEANQTAADFIRHKIHEIVRDPEVADLLTPEQPLGCKRLCVDTGYYEAFNRPNVTLVDIHDAPIDRITPRGLIAKGEEYEFDAIVFATGFDAMTGTLLRMDIRGRGGRTLAEKWADGPRMYLGLATSGFPNLFAITGPGSPSVLSNMLPSIEQHVNWITDCIDYMREHGKKCIETTVESEDAWAQQVTDIADLTIFSSCNSWYVGANIPGKPRVFMPYLGFPPYVEKCNEVASRGYEGFELTE